MTDQTDSPSQVILVDQLQPGVYISLKQNWFDHPFLFNQFKVVDQEQIETLRKLGISKVAYVPDKSTEEPLPAPEVTGIAPVRQDTGPSPEQMALMEEKRRRIERLNTQKRKIAECDKAYTHTAQLMKDIMRNLFSRPEEAARQATELVHGVVDSFMSDSDIAIQLMAQKKMDENTFYHLINVLILSMILGKQLRLSTAQMRVLGLGALFHDIGKGKVPPAILRKTEPLNRPETAFYRMHVDYGVSMAKDTGFLPPEVIDVIRYHHEAMDGSGYPRGARGEEITIPARLVTIANAYDNLCNPIQVDKAMTPYEAMSFMFSRQSRLYDERALKTFVTCLGVYPPGSIVELSNGMVGMTVTVNQKQLLKPSVLVYDKEIPKNEAIIVDLATEEGLTIARCFRPQMLTPEVYKYLNPRTNVRYYFQENE